MLESEVDQPSEFDGGVPQSETQLVPLHPRNLTRRWLSATNQRDRSFHHRSPSSVTLGEVAFFPRLTGFDQLFVVTMETENAPVFGGGAPFPKWASLARTPKTAARPSGDRDRVARRTRGGPCSFVHDEVISRQSVGDGRGHGQGLIARRCLALLNALSVSPEPSAPSPRIWSPGCSPARSVRPVRPSEHWPLEHGGGHQAGLGFDGDLGLLTVPILRTGFVHVTGLGVDGGNNPVSDFPDDLPGAVVLLLDILASHQG